MKDRSFVGKMTVTLAMLLVATPTAFARNARSLRVAYTASLNGKPIPAGEYKVSWETHSPEATVTLEQKKEVVATVQGKWVDRPAKYEANSVVYATNPDGSRTILEIRFAGLKGALVFGELSSQSQLLPADTATLASAQSSPLPAAPAQKIRFVGKAKLAHQDPEQALVI